MLIGERLRGMREERNIAQGDIVKRTGLIRAYISRVERSDDPESLQTAGFLLERVRVYS
jgi:transcriptional regulator with XRE-family HTH domain